jgi:hypothetical protein
MTFMEIRHPKFTPALPRQGNPDEVSIYSVLFEVEQNVFFSLLLEQGFGFDNYYKVPSVFIEIRVATTGRAMLGLKSA